MTGKAVSVEAELVPNGKEATRETLSAALAKTDAADVETVFARVEQDIANLPNTVKAFQMRDGLRVVEAAAQVLDRHDIRHAAARAVAEVEQWIARHNPPRPVGRPPKTAGDENLGRRPTFSQREGGSGEAAKAVSAEELRDIRRAHPDPADDAAMRTRMDRIEAAGKVVSRRALRTEVRRERQAGAAEPAPKAAPAADVPKQDSAPAALAPVDTAAAATLHVCTVEELREKVEEDSIDAVAVALHGAEEDLINAVVGFGEFAVRPGGLVLVQCPGWAVADVASIGDGPDDKDNQWMDYESLLACVGAGTSWFPVLVFRRRDDDGVDSSAQGDDDAVGDDDADSSAEHPTLFRADSGADGWRQVIAAWLPVGAEVWEPCCGSGQVLAGAAAAGMRIVGADADPAQVAATRAALGKR